MAGVKFRILPSVKREVTRRFSPRRMGAWPKWELWSFAYVPKAPFPVWPLKPRSLRYRHKRRQLIIMNGQRLCHLAATCSRGFLRNPALDLGNLLRRLRHTPSSWGEMTEHLEWTTDSPFFRPLIERAGKFDCSLFTALWGLRGCWSNCKTRPISFKVFYVTMFLNSLFLFSFLRNWIEILEGNTLITW